MSMTSCKECNGSISKNANKCPHCGAPRKKTSLITWIIAGIAGFWLIGFIGNLSTGSSPVNREASAKQMAMDSAKLDYQWGKAGFGNVMEADFTIDNRGDTDIKDIEIKCTHFAKSGTQIDSNSRTIFDVVPAKSKKKFAKFNMGFVHSQAESSSCVIANLSV